MASSSAYHRPRRPNSETISYLRGLPLNVENTKDEVTRFLASSGNCHKTPQHDKDYNENEFQDFPSTLAAAFSALDEVKAEVASLAGDEYGSQSLEVLAKIAVPYSETAARILIQSCSGYFLHLATHRYGSHVLQTMLQLATTNLSKIDLALHDEAPSLLRISANSEGGDFELPSLYDLILGVVDELSPHVSDLAVHLCGSHVLRTLLCILGGVHMENRNAVSPTSMGANQRGKHKPSKKKKRKTNSSDDLAASSAPHSGTMAIIYNDDVSRIDPDELRPTLERLTNALLGNDGGKEPGALQQLACHESAGPLLIVLIRVLTSSSDSARKGWVEEQKLLQSGNGNDKNSSPTTADFRLGISKSEPRYLNGSLADKVVRQIICWKEGVLDQKIASDVIYGLSGEPRGSHLLETILRLCPDEFHESIVQCGDFLNPSSLQDYVEHDVSNFVIQNLLVSIRSKEQAETMLKILQKVISSGLAVNPEKKRRGVLWRAAEVAAQYRVEQESLLKSIRLGFVTLSAFNDNPSESTTSSTNADVEGGKKVKQRKKASDVQLKHCIPLLIGLKRNEGDGHAISLDPAGTRSVFHMLRFSPRLCQDTLHGLINEISAEDLVSIAKDGMGSRCLMDGILDGPINTPIFAEAARLLRTKLVGHWASLAGDRVGQHSVKKLFKALPKIDDKAKLVEELASAGNRLNGTAMGRSVVEVCFVEEFIENRKQWREKISKLSTKEMTSMLPEILEDKEISGASTNDLQEQQGEKSKRKRRRKKAITSEGEQHDVEPEPKIPKTNVKAGAMSVDSILKAMET
jgi:hypothetical protein